MNELTERIIGALGLGIAGLIASLFLVFNEGFKNWLKGVFGLTGTETESPKPIQSIVLIGYWSGDGWRYSLKGQLHRDQGVLEGQFQWTLQDFPEDYPHPRWATNRLQRSGTEYVRGVLTAGKLTVAGYNAHDPYDLGLLLADYSVEIDERAQSFTGTSVNHSDKKTGTLTGTVSVQR
jgi:hypothetical protein